VTRGALSFSQGRHESELLAAKVLENVLKKHDVQVSSLVAAITELYLPAVQFLQFVDFAFTVYFPASQAWHASTLKAATVELAFPIGHSRQAELLDAPSTEL
jgi:hypothetical protein